MFHSRLCDIHRIFSVAHGKDIHADFFTVDLQLFYRGRTVDIAGRKKGLSSLCLQFAGQLGSRCRLTCALQTDHHIDSDLIPRFQRKLGLLISHQGNQLVMNNLNDHLSGIQAIHYILSDGFLLNGFGKLPDDLKIDICLQQGHFHFFQSRLDIRLCKRTLAAELFEYILQFFT